MILPGHMMMVGKSGAGYLPIPPMTSNTTPAGFVVSASTEGAGPAWQAFDQAGPGTFWQTATGAANGSWIQFASSIPFEAVSVDIQNGINAGRSPRNFDILGSNDGVSFDVLFSVTNVGAWDANQIRTFPLTSFGLYTHYRVSISLSYDSSFVRLGEITFTQEGDL